MKSSIYHCFPEVIFSRKFQKSHLNILVVYIQLLVFRILSFIICFRVKFLFSFILVTLSDNREVVVSKRDRGQALIVACRYLPESILSYPNQRERMLNEAARCFEQAGDRWGLKECQQLLANIKKECGEAGEGISRRSAILTS